MAFAITGTVSVNDASDNSTSANCTLRFAINLINGVGSTGGCTHSGVQSPPEIHFALTTPATIPLRSALQPQAAMKIVGPGTSALTLLGGAGQPSPYRVFDLEENTGYPVGISYLTIASGGISGDFGGGVFVCCGYSLTLDHVDMHDNVSDGGGGALGAADNVSITDSSFENNSAVRDDASAYASISYGGAIFAQAGTLSLTRVTIANNTVGSTLAKGDPGVGGALMIGNSATAVITDSTLSGNHARGAAMRTGFNPDGNGLGGQGGGLFVGGTLVMHGVTVSGNDAKFEGGGLFVIGTADAINSTIAANSAHTGSSPSRGGGLYIDAANGFGAAVRLTLTNATVFANSAVSAGGMYNTHTTAADIVIHNTAFGNAGTGESGGDIINGTGAGFTADFDLVENAASAGGLSNGTNGNVIGQSARFLGLTNNGGLTQTVAFAPVPAISPLRDAGSNSLAVDELGNPLTRDQRDSASFPRIFHGTVDIGAYEDNGDLIFKDGFE